MNTPTKIVLATVGVSIILVLLLIVSVAGSA